MSYGGNGGSSRISTASDAALNSPVDGQVLTYSAGIQKWQNNNVPVPTPAAIGAPTTSQLTNAIATQATTNSTTFVPFGPTAPDHTKVPVWVDTSTVPPVLKLWNGTAWAALNAGTSTTTLANTVSPTISGTASTGNVLTVSTGTWTPTPDSYTYQWNRNGNQISGATSSSYTVVTADSGMSLTVTVSAIKSGYTSGSVTTTGVNIGAPTPTTGITASGATLQLNGSAKRFSGANAYWLGLDDNAGSSGGSFPSHTQITNAITGMKEMGISLVRAHSIGISTGTSNSYESSAGVYNDNNLDAADYAVYQAKQAGIYLMIPLTDNWNYYHGGKWNFVHWAYQQNSSGITDTPGTTKDDPNERIFFANTAPGLRVRALYKDYISHWLNHVNPYTGLAYKNDPTIAILETGNEIYYAAQLGSNEWTQDIASYIKSIAPNKLVADGSAADRVAVSSQPGLTASAVDIVGSHYYPQTQSGSYPPVAFGASGTGYPAGTALQQLAADATAASNAGKAFIVGEYPWTRSDVASFYSTVASTASIGADLFWSFIADSDSGTPEIHGGSFGSDDFPVHRPYAGASEQNYAPALASHISAISGITATNGAATAPAASANLIATNSLRHASDATQFTAGSATLSTDSSVAQEGGSSIRVAPSGSGVYPYLYGTTSSAWAPVTAGSQYTGVASFRTTTSGSFGFQVALVWYKSDGTYLSASTGSYVAAVQNSWIQGASTAAAPVNAAYAVIQVQSGSSMNATDVFNIDEYGIYAGSNTIWNG